MPELPEVETIVRGLQRRTVGDTIESVWIGLRQQPLKSPAALIAKTLEGKRIARVHRAGKHIVFDLEQHAAPQRKRAAGTANVAAQWVVHLGMTGRLVVCEPAAEVAKHTHLVAKLASGSELRFVDPRMFGKLSVYSGNSIRRSRAAGSERRKFRRALSGRRTPIKSALLNQKLLRGVGNIYADESLFRAGVRPRRRAAVCRAAGTGEASTMRFRRCLREAIAPAAPRSTTWTPTGEEGLFQLEHRVYRRTASPAWSAARPSSGW